MKEKKGFIDWNEAGPRKVVDGIEVAPDRVKVYFNLQKECLSVIDPRMQRQGCSIVTLIGSSCTMRSFGCRRPVGSESFGRSARMSTLTLSVSATTSVMCNRLSLLRRVTATKWATQGTARWNTTRFLYVTARERCGARSAYQSQVINFVTAITIPINIRRLWMTSTTHRCWSPSGSSFETKRQSGHTSISSTSRSPRRRESHGTKD